MPKLADYWKLFTLARKRFEKKTNYLQFQQWQGLLLLRFLRAKGITLRGKRVLDLGCGRGGYSGLFAQEGGKVYSIDINVVPSMGGHQYDFVLADALHIPFEDDGFDFIFCASLIEHVAKPQVLLAEIHRVLSSHGSCYLSFPPFYSPVGGHQFKPYHLLGERVALALTGHKNRSYADSCGNWGLYPLTIGKAKLMLDQVGFSIEDISVRFVPMNLTRIPLLGEFLTWHAQFIARKV